MQYELGFIGAGYMAEAIAKAAINKGLLHAGQIIASDPNPQRQSVFGELGIVAGADNHSVITQSKQILLAVKPQVMAQAAVDLGSHGAADQVVLSIMAGITTQKLGQAIAKEGAVPHPRIVRVMPNTPLQVGFGMAAVALGQDAQEGDEALAMWLFGAAGEVVLVEESKLDAVTALSGSGPAYVFYLAEAMQRAATTLGLEEHAEALVRQTILGAAHLMIASRDTPAQLRSKVTSPGGTTEAAIKHLEAHHAADTIIDAIQAAHQRSIELGS